MSAPITVERHTYITWSAPDILGRIVRGAYRITVRDLGDTLGVGVYDPDRGQLIHAFYASTTRPDEAEKTAQHLIDVTVRAICEAKNPHAVNGLFYEQFPMAVRAAGYVTLLQDRLEEAPEPSGATAFGTPDR